MTDLKEIEQSLKQQTKKELSRNFSFGAGMQEMWKAFRGLFGWSSDDQGLNTHNWATMHKNQITLQLEEYEQNLRKKRKIVKK